MTPFKNNGVIYEILNASVRGLVSSLIFLLVSFFAKKLEDVRSNHFCGVTDIFLFLDFVLVSSVLGFNAKNLYNIITI